MKITCDSCGAKYTIADDKVRGRKVKIRCKGCGTAIVVDGQQEKAGTSSPPPAEAPGDSELPVDMGAAAGSAPPPATSDDRWSVNLSETDQRTLTTQEVVDGWKSGVVTADAFVWKEGMADWLPILECAELKPLLKDKTSSPNRASATPAARVTGGRSQPGADLFAGAATAGADDDEPAPAPPPARPAPGKPPAPGAGTEEIKPTGARNENSVLFSLDALKAGFSGPAPTKPEPPNKKGATNRVGADDLLGAPSMGGGSPMFSLADNNALLTAPAPPEPPKPKIVESFAPTGAPAPEARGSKKIVIALVVLLVLVIGGGAAALSINAKNKEEALAAAAASASAAILQAREEELKAKEAAEKAREEKRLEEERARAAEEKAKEAAAKGEATPAASAEAGKPGSAAKPGATTPGTTTPGAKKEEKKKEEAAPPPAVGSDQPFSKAAAVSALSAAAGSAGSCKKLGGPTGTGRVTVTFAPSGRVTTANVEGAPFAGTSVGGCVASLFRKAHVPAFSGNAVTVSKSFSIN
ncbi:MAG: zinc-ribbon domain-containing protein [Myxococcota bacterium]